MNNPFLHTWGTPLILAALTIFGLLAALLGTGFWHLLSWIAMIIPVAVILRHIMKSGKKVRA